MATVFNDKIFAQEAFQQLTSLLAPFNIFARNISPAAAEKGDTVVVPLFGNATATTFTQSTTVWEQSGGTVSAITVSLNLQDITPVDLTARQLAESSNANMFDQFASQMAQAHANRMLSHLFAGITTGSFGTAAVSTAIANYDFDVLPLIRKAMINDGVRGPMALVVNPDVEAYMLGDTNLALALNRGGTQTLNEGQLGRLFGFDIYCAPTLGANAVSLVGFATGRNAMAVAFRGIGDLLPAEEYDAVEILTDPDTGLSMTYTRHWSRAQGKWFLNMSSLFGFANAVTKEMNLLAQTD